jgi:hypothetical protein
MEKPELSSPSNYKQQLEKYGNRIDIAGQSGWNKDLKFRYKNIEEEIIKAFDNIGHD